MGLSPHGTPLIFLSRCAHAIPAGVTERTTEKPGRWPTRRMRNLWACFHCIPLTVLNEIKMRAALHLRRHQPRPSPGPAPFSSGRVNARNEQQQQQQPPKANFIIIIEFLGKTENCCLSFPTFRCSQEENCSKNNKREIWPTSPNKM